MSTCEAMYCNDRAVATVTDGNGETHANLCQSHAKAFVRFLSNVVAQMPVSHIADERCWGGRRFYGKFRAAPCIYKR